MLFKPILALHIMNFSSSQNYWPLQYFHWGATAPPPPPRIDASANSVQNLESELDINIDLKKETLSGKG